MDPLEQNFKKLKLSLGVLPTNGEGEGDRYIKKGEILIGSNW
jgi:hypothetical protein